MILFLSSQDIKEIIVGAIEQGKLTVVKKIETEPENFLNALKRCLSRWRKSFEDIQGVVVVTGPGSATALRTSVTIANGFGFAREIPVVGLTNRDHESPVQLIRKSKTTIEQGLQKKFQPLSPVYERRAV